ncbi:hypothetical protein [Cystobacter ferrugineus]|uniref:hypothetical protein n=1 Tax=Cystobacter ferrugineus TaxID=83449 RepID=UPI001FEA85BE|nr:hypothetical protein [Cystobacter ferrugineus]
MDDKGTIAEAVLVDDRGQILKVGTASALRQGLGSQVETIQLAPAQVLMPGFFDPHMHFLPTLLQSLLGTHDLAPCLPPPYQSGSSSDCKSRNDVLSALARIRAVPEGIAAESADGIDALRPGQARGAGGRGCRTCHSCAARRWSHHHR